MDPAEVDAARAIYEKVMENIRVPGTLGAPLPQAGEASGPAASQPSMPAVSLLPAAPPAFGPKDSTSEVASGLHSFTLHPNLCLLKAPVVYGCCCCISGQQDVDVQLHCRSMWMMRRLTPHESSTRRSYGTSQSRGHRTRPCCPPPPPPLNQRMVPLR